MRHRYTPSPFEGEYGDKGPSIADALKAGYNVICLAFADSFTGDGGFQVHTDLCPIDKDHTQLKESARDSNSESHRTLRLTLPSRCALAAATQPRLRAQ